MRGLEVEGLQLRRGDFQLNIPAFHVGPGTCVGILGRNGAGKTTFMHLLAGDLKQQAGSIRDRHPLGRTGRIAYHHRVLTSWYDKVIFRDYEVRRGGVGPSVHPVGRPVPACGNYGVSPPMMSQDGRELAARDEATASTKIFRLNHDGTCEQEFDLGVQAGKVAWQAGGRRVAFAIPRGVVQDGIGLLWRADDDDRELAGIFVDQRDEMRLTRVLDSA